jgi:hypothetical protein
LPTLSVTCFTGLPIPAGILSSPLPVTPVIPLTVLFSPVVALSATVFTVPVARPVPLFTPPTTAFEAVPTTPGFFGGVGCVVFLTAAGVGFVPSGLTAALTEGFLTGVAFDAGEAVFVVDFAGVVFVAFNFGAELAWFLMLGPFTAGTGLADAGMVFFAETGVFAAGLAVSLPAILLAAGVDLAVVGVEIFFAAAGVAGFRGVLFAGVVELCDTAGVAGFRGVLFVGVVELCDAAVDDVLVSFAGAFRTGVDVVPVAFVAAGVAFLTGVVFAADEGVFFAAEEPPPATFWRLATPAASISTTLIMLWVQQVCRLHATYLEAQRSAA